MSVVEIQIIDPKTLPAAMAGMREWLDHRRFQPSVFRSIFTETSLLLRIEFPITAEASEFARAFYGTVAGASCLPNQAA